MSADKVGKEYSISFRCKTEEKNDDNYETVIEKEKWRKKTMTFTRVEEGSQRSETAYFASYWEPVDKDDVKALMFICHGYADYISPSYEELAQSLCENGVLVFGHDHVGHGRSSGMRVQVTCMEDYVDPILAHVTAVKENFPDKPLFLFGHSMGGLISLFALFARQDIFKGFVAVAPLVEMDAAIASPFRKMLAKVFQAIFPSLALFGLNADAVTRHPMHTERYKNDPLVWHGGFRAKHSWVLLQALEHAQNNLSAIRIPIIILQGTEDTLVNSNGSRKLLEESSSEDKEMVELKGAYHNLMVELEPVKRETFNKIITFIKDRLH